jgi:hypothetical protein
MKRGKNKKAQQIVGLSFSTIFSIILIIFILAAAFIAIKSFLGIKKCAQISMFIEDFDNEITNIWNSEGDISKFRRSLPSGIEYVCFANLTKPASGGSFEQDVYLNIGVYEGEGHNMFFYPGEYACDIPSYYIAHLDMERITRTKNPYCIPVADNSVTINLEKKINERYVRLN